MSYKGFQYNENEFYKINFFSEDKKINKQHIRAMIMGIIALDMIFMLRF